MAKVAYWTDDAGSVAIASFPPDVDPSADMISAIVPAGKTAHVVDASTLPSAPPEHWSVAADGTITIVVPPEPVPQTASAGDFMRALYDLGWYDSAKAAVASAGGLSQILWDRAAIFERQHPMVIQIATAIGKTSAELDGLFRQTKTYQ